MITNFFRIIFFCLIIICQNNAYSQNSPKSFDKKNVANYFSALISYDNNQNRKYLNFFEPSRLLKESNKDYVRKYLISLVLEGKIKKAINESKIIEDNKINESYEMNLLLAISNLHKKNYKKNFFYVNKIKNYKQENKIQHVILSTLEEYAYLFYHNKINIKSDNNFGHLTVINNAFQSCYLDSTNTEAIFDNVTNPNKGDYSRYLFFHINFLISQGKVEEAKNLSKKIDILNSSLLAAQTKDWIDKKKFNNFQEIFSCKNPKDVISEFFYLIANLYSTEGDLKKSNFYLKISNYLNPKFIFNSSLFAENYFTIKNFKLSEFFLDTFDNNTPIYNWYKFKKKAEIIKNKNNLKDSFNFINSKFNKIKSPSLRTVFDMANTAKNFEKYEMSIKYYSEILLNIEQNSLLYADILYRRGGSYERLGKNQKADQDFLKSLEINDDPYTLNYLAYSWLERDYKINVAIQMLEKANKENGNDPYIIDSVGWAYYLTKDYINAEIFLKRAVKLMPNDPIVNDHYGDVLWKLGRKIQANYFWENVLTFENTKDEMKKNIYLKLLKGPNKV